MYQEGTAHLVLWFGTLAMMRSGEMQATVTVSRAKLPIELQLLPPAFDLHPRDRFGIAGARARIEVEFNAGTIREEVTCHICEAVARTGEDMGNETLEVAPGEREHLLQRRVAEDRFEVLLCRHDHGGHRDPRRCGGGRVILGYARCHTVARSSHPHASIHPAIQSAFCCVGDDTPVRLVAQAFQGWE